MNKQRDPGDFYPGGAIQVDSVQELAKGDKGDDAMTQETKDAINALSEINPEAADFGPRKLAEGINGVVDALKQMAVMILIVVGLTAATACGQDGVFAYGVRFADLLNGQVVTGVVVRGVATTGDVANAAMAVQTEVGTRAAPEYYISGGETYTYYGYVQNGIYFDHRYRYSHSSGEDTYEYFIVCDFYNRTATVNGAAVAFTNSFDLVWPLDGYPVGTPYGSTSVVDRVFTMARVSDIQAHNIDDDAHEARFAEKVSTNNATYLQTVSLAGSALQVGHNTDAGAHSALFAGKANSSNATLTGTATINGDTIIGANGVTNAIFANQKTIVKDVVISTNVVRVVSTQSVYVATVTSPCVITQDVSALTLATNQTAFWTTRINVTDWGATNGITFATNIAAYAGDFTVTGCYDFACSLLCDGRIEMRQTFPTVERSVPVLWNVLTGGTQNALGQPFITATIRTNAVYTYKSKSSDYIISTFTFNGTALTNITSSRLHAKAVNLYYYAGVAYVLPQPRYTLSGYIMRLNCSSGNFATDGFTHPRFSADSGYAVGIEISVPTGTGDIYLTGCEQRKMNELEIRAYNNGWRPQ